MGDIFLAEQLTLDRYEKQVDDLLLSGKEELTLPNDLINDKSIEYLSSKLASNQNIKFLSIGNDHKVSTMDSCALSRLDALLTQNKNIIGIEFRNVDSADYLEWQKLTRKATNLIYFKSSSTALEYGFDNTNPQRNLCYSLLGLEENASILFFEHDLKKYPVKLNIGNNDVKHTKEELQKLRCHDEAIKLHFRKEKICESPTTFLKQCLDRNLTIFDWCESLGGLLVDPTKKLPLYGKTLVETYDEVEATLNALNVLKRVRPDLLGFEAVYRKCAGAMHGLQKYHEFNHEELHSNRLYLGDPKVYYSLVLRRANYLKTDPAERGSVSK